MNKLILFSLLTILLVSLSSSELTINSDEKPTSTKDLTSKAIEKENKTKLINTYGMQFEEVNSFNSYKQYKDITIINVTIKEGYARIITTTKKFEEVLN